MRIEVFPGEFVVLRIIAPAYLAVAKPTLPDDIGMH
jgi:hypothetical protein